MVIRKYITDRFKRLRWKLTFTYVVATVGTLLFFELILLLLAGAAFFSSVNLYSLPPQLIKSANIYHTPSLRVILADPSPDPKTVTDWLERFEAFPTSFESIEGLPTVIDQGGLRALVVGRDGRLLGRSRPGLVKDQKINEPFDPQALSGSRAPLRAALAGRRDVDQLYTISEADSRLVMVVPVWDEADQQVLGALIISADVPTSLELMHMIGAVLLASLIFVTITAALTGTGFGWLAARGLVRRLDRFSTATQAWSQGDFTAQIDDPAADELGQLAGRLNDMADQLQRLLETRQELVVSEERNRLARDLHDSVKQQAFAATTQLSTARRLLDQDSAAAATHIEEAEALTDHLRQELTSLIQKLRPTALDDQGLVAAVHSYAAGWSKRNGITLEVRVEQERPLAPDTEQTIFRILEEALANIARHSQAEKAEISLVYGKSDVACTITDDGVGFDTDQDPNGFGLRSMQERVGLLGGTWAVDSGPERGTQITIKFPNIESPIMPKEPVI